MHNEHAQKYIYMYWRTKPSLTPGAVGALVAHSGSSGGSLVATPDCDTAVLGSVPAISPAYSGLPVLRWAAIWDGTLL